MKIKEFPSEHGDRLWDQLCGAVLTEWANNHEPVPHLLYHYTTADGLLGILSSQSFWMTDLRYMNDLSELQYAEELIREVLTAKANQYGDDLRQGFFQRIKRSFNPYEKSVSVFSTSFCENGNLLSQWRAYGSRGGGYAIALDFFHLLGFVSKPCALRKVIYDREEQSAIVDKIVDRFCMLLSELADGQTVEEAVGNNVIPAFCQAFQSVVGELMFCFKHPEFREEQEWRLVHSSSNDFTFDKESKPDELKFRSFTGNLIPYTILSFENAVTASRLDNFLLQFPIVELIIGPTLNPRLNRESAKSLLTKLNPDISPNIRESGIPLRWL